MLGRRAIRAAWQVAGVVRDDEAGVIAGDDAATRLDVLSQSRGRSSDAGLNELVPPCARIMGGDVTAFEAGTSTPWLIVHAIDGSWCEVETDVPARVRRMVSDARVAA